MVSHERACEISRKSSLTRRANTVKVLSATLSPLTLKAIQVEGIDLIKASWRYRNHIIRCKTKKDRLGNPVELRLSFDEWLRIWIESGRYHQMGKRRGEYVMARHNDVGHYEVGNVSIITHSKNVSDRQVSRSI